MVILNDVTLEFSELFNTLLKDNPQGYSLREDYDYAEKIIVLSVLLSFGPVYFLALRFFRRYYVNEEENHNKSIDETKKEKREITGLEEFDKKKSFPGSGTLVVFLYVVLFLAAQRYILNPEEFLNIGVNWIFLTFLLNLIPLLALALFDDKLSERLIL